MLIRFLLMWILILGFSRSEVYYLNTDLQKGTLKNLTGKILENITTSSWHECSGECLSLESCDFFFFGETMTSKETIGGKEKDENNNCLLWTDSGNDNAEPPEGYDYYFYLKRPDSTSLSFTGTSEPDTESPDATTEFGNETEPIEYIDDDGDGADFTPPGH